MREKPSKNCKAKAKRKRKGNEEKERAGRVRECTRCMYTQKKGKESFRGLQDKGKEKKKGKERGGRVGECTPLHVNTEERKKTELSLHRNPSTE